MIAMLVLGLLTRLGLAGAGGPDRSTFTAFLDSWHDFYLLAGTAAVTLAGLLFLSLSFNMEHMVHASRSHLLYFARNTMFVYIVTLILSLSMLVPNTPMQLVGFELFIVGTILTVVSAVALWRLVTDPDATFSRRHRFRRGSMPIIAGVVLLWTSIDVMHGDIVAFFRAVWSVCALLASAMWASWDLLVGVARSRREHGASQR